MTRRALRAIHHAGATCRRRGGRNHGQPQCPQAPRHTEASYSLGGTDIALAVLQREDVDDTRHLADSCEAVAALAATSTCLRVSTDLSGDLEVSCPKKVDFQ